MKGALLMVAAAALLAPIHAQQQYYMAAPMYYPAQMQPGYNPYMAYNPYMGYPMMPVPNQMTPAPNQSQQQPQQQSNVWDDPLFWSIKEGNKDIDDHLAFEKNMLDDNFLQMSKPAAEPPGVTGGPIWQMPEVSAMTSNLGTGDRLRPVAVLPKHTSSAMHDDGHDTHEATKGASESHGHHHFGYKEGEGKSKQLMQDAPDVYM